MFGTAIVGALLAGAYGILHDEITFSISPEYFTKLKFNQFDYADFGLGDRVFVATVGFLATWWVGFIAAWFLARRLIPNQLRSRAYCQLRSAFACVFAVGLLFGTIGFIYGLWRGPNADYSYWAPAVDELGIADTWAFVRVAYIHNAGYFGALIGLIIALTLFRPDRDLRVRTTGT
jgi:hypothetical protein